MSDGYRIATVLGTARPGSYTSMALALVHDELRRVDVAVEAIDPSRLSLPFPGQPATPDSARIKEQVRGAAGVILTTPEYHGSFSSMLKLVIENLGFPSVLAGKPIALLGVAAGRIGAIKSLEALRGVCAHVGGIVLPAPISIANVRDVFTAEGECQEPGTEKLIRSVATNLLNYLGQHVCPALTLEAIVRGEITVEEVAARN